MKIFFLVCLVLGVAFYATVCLGSEARYFVKTDADNHDAVWIEHKNGEKELLIDKLYNPGKCSSEEVLCQKYDPEPFNILGDRIVPSLDGETMYFIIQAWQTSGALMAFDVAKKEGYFLADANEFWLITKDSYAGKLAIFTHDYPLVGYGTTDFWWVYDPVEKKRVRLFSADYDFEGSDDYETSIQDKLGLQ